MYRGHDAFLFTSRYEAWGMPVLEAMASGLAVVASRCLGVDSFAVHGSNALLADSQVLQLVPDWSTSAGRASCDGGNTCRQTHRCC